MKFLIATAAAALPATLAIDADSANQLANNLENFSDSNIQYASIAQALKVVAKSIKDQASEIPDDKFEELKTFIEGNENEQAMMRTTCEGEDCQTGTLNLEALFGYGCWFFFGRIDSALGRGPPVDAYDAICQKMTLCYRCIFVDSDNEGDDDCDPFQTTFEASLSTQDLLGGGVSNVTTECQTSNQNNCSWRTCSCAMTMITGFFNLAFDTSNPYDDSLKHSNGFDYNLECPTQSSAEDRQCCGFYPQRRTYDHKSTRNCCHDVSIYNPLRHVCCDDGTHVGIGHSCE